MIASQITVTRGHPTDEELAVLVAVLVAVLAAAKPGTETERSVPDRAPWTRPARYLSPRFWSYNQPFS
jgi:acyl-CoA carboxylase epsilon subunit-like protein